MKAMRTSHGISTTLATVVIVILIIVAAAGWGMYAAAPITKTVTSTQVVTSTGATSSTATSTQMVKVTIGTAFPTAMEYWLLLDIAQGQGFFASNGISATITSFTGGALLDNALEAGQVEIGLTTTSPVIDAISRGDSIKIVGVYVDSSPFQVYVSGNSTINSPAQLNGTTFSLSNPSSIEATYASLFASKFNLNFNYVSSGSDPASVALVQSGKASAFVTSPESLPQFLVSKQVRPLYNISDVLPTPWADTCIVATNAMITSAPAALKATVNALDQAINYGLNNPSYTQSVIMNHSSTITSEAAAFDYAVVSAHWRTSLTVDPQALSNVEQVNIDTQTTPSNIMAPVNSTYTNDFIPA